MVSGSDQYPPFDPDEPLELHDLIPEFGEFSGAASPPTEYKPELFPCETCTRLMTTNFHLAAVEAPDFQRFYHPARSIFKQVNAMLMGETGYKCGAGWRRY